MSDNHMANEFKVLHLSLVASNRFLVLLGKS